jgi:hypothetical protein
MKVESAISDTGNLVERLQAAFRSLAYHHKSAEASLYGLFVTGIPLWSLLAADWWLIRLSLSLHTILGLVVFPLVIMPFWFAHRRLLACSGKPSLKISGRLLELLLILCGGSGFYLLLIGNPGSELGSWMQWVHLYSSLLLVPLLLKHAWRWSVVRLRR